MFRLQEAPQSSQVPNRDEDGVPERRRKGMEAWRVYGVGSADMMRIFLLHQLHHKECVYHHVAPSRLQRDVFPGRETVMESSRGTRPVSILWHEGLAGRNVPDVASAFIRYVQLQRDVKELIIWLDDCTAQNKNCMLITGLLQTVNHRADHLQKIMLKYLQKGHTSMSADAVH